MTSTKAQLAKARSILGVGSTDDESVLRQAFRRRSMETHPDRDGSAEEFAQVRAAYALLLEHLSGPGNEWLIDDESDDVDVRIVDEKSRPRRQRFEEMFLDALRREYGQD